MLVSSNKTPVQATTSAAKHAQLIAVPFVALWQQLCQCAVARVTKEPFRPPVRDPHVFG